ncbi:MAG: anti-sigma factor domain-containing protein [Verrucomicrobiales bacterium]
MTPEERSELASLHALDLLSGVEEEQAILLEHSDADFAQEVKSQRDAIGAFAAEIEPLAPSDTLSERILSLPMKDTNSPAPSRNSWSGWAVAALLALSCVGLFWQFVTAGSEQSALEDKNQQLEADSQLSRDQLASLGEERDNLRQKIAEIQSRNEELLAKIEQSNTTNQDLLAKLGDLEKKNQLDSLRIASLEGQIEEFKNTEAIVVWDQKQNKGRIRLTNLPAVEADKDYQLWIVDPAHDNPVDAGLIVANADGSAEIPFTAADKVTKASAFAISIEKKGGAPVAEGPIVFVGK